MTQEDQRFSRPALAASRLGDLAPDRHRFSNKRVLLTGEPAILATKNGQACFVDSLRLLVRICTDIRVAIPSGAVDVSVACETLMADPFFARSVQFVDDSQALTNYDAILSVGTVARPDLPWTVINSNGWLARVSSGSSHLADDCGMSNPIGALAAAALGVTDVFKRLIRLKPLRGQLLDGLSFSLSSYRCNEDVGPALTESAKCELMLVGVGAIGNAIVHLLQQLPVGGRAVVVDRQKFAEENLGTCLLIGESDVGSPKVELAIRSLRGRMEVMGFEADLELLKPRLGTEIAYPSVVLTGLDSIDARHAAQALWPDLIVDGAVGDFACQVSRHEWAQDEGCLICLFRHPAGPDSTLVACRATGLSCSRANGPDAAVTDEDVRTAPAGRQEWLRQRVGRRICSVIQEGVAAQISGDEHSGTFAPTAPFVAALSGCMVVGELMKRLLGVPSRVESRFQLDMLRGPAAGLMCPHGRRSDCDCTVRAHNIAVWRSRRQAARN